MLKALTSDQTPVSTRVHLACGTRDELDNPMLGTSGDGRILFKKSNMDRLNG